MKKLLTLGLTTLALSANASTLETLKSTPVNQYELGLFKLGFAAFYIGNEIAGQSVKGTHFDIKGVSTDIQGDKMAFTVSYVGKSKYLTPTECSSLHVISTRIIQPDSLIKNVWEGLSESDYSELESNFTVTTKLVGEDNSSLSITCTE